jgi:hypothetical protein
MKLVPDNLIDPKSIPAPPNLVRSFSTGFDTISNHLGLVLFPVALDLFLWWGPRLRIESWLQGVLSTPLFGLELQTADAQEMMNASKELWLELSGQFNLLTILRTYPVGVTSLMAGMSPVAAPTTTGPVWQTSSLLAIFGWIFGLGLLGLGLGTFFYAGVSQAVLQKRVVWRQVFREWPLKYARVVGLALFWVILFVGVSLLFSLLLTLLAIIGIGIGTFTMLLYGFLMIWLLIPLAFSAHGIFVYGRTVIDSIKDSARLTRLTMPTTMLFLLTLVLVNQGLNLIWSLPDETSWMSLVGILGHAFVSTALLAASFVYYRDTSQWLQQVLQKLQTAKIAPI